MQLHGIRARLAAVFWRVALRPLVLVAPSVGSAFGQRSASALLCPTVGPVIRQIEATSVYRKGDQTRSEMDFRLWAKNTYLVAPTRHFQSVVSILADASSRDRSGVVRSCLLQILRSWAQNSAFLDKPDTPNGRFVQGWVLGTLALVILKSDLRDAAEADPHIRPWLEKLTKDVIAFYQKRKTKNNLTSWAAMSVLAASTITNDRAARTIATSWYQHAIDDISDEGLPSHELGRGQRAVHYFYFGAQPLYIFYRLQHLGSELPPPPGKLKHYLDNLVDNLSARTLDKRFGEQVKPKEIGWLSLYFGQLNSECRGLDQREFIPRLGGRVDLLGQTLNAVEGSRSV